MTDESARGTEALRQTMAKALERDLRRSLAACIRISMTENDLPGDEQAVVMAYEAAGGDETAGRLAAELIDRLDDIANEALVEAEARGIAG